jgi:Na+/proline symporter
MINSVRFFAAKTGQDARKGAGLVMVLMLVGAAFWFIPAITSRLLYSEQVLAVDIANPAESAFAIAALNLLPAGLIGLMMVAMFSASMSSLDSALNWNAGIFVRNVFPPLVRLFGKPEPAEDDPRLLTLGRVFTILFGIVMILVAIYFGQSGGQGVFETGFAINAAFALPMMVPLLLALFIRRLPGWAGLASLICGLSVSAVRLIFDIEMATFWVSIFAASAAAIGFFATMPFWKLAPQKDHERTRAFFQRMHTPVDFAKEVGEASDHVQLNMIGFFTTGMAIFVALLLLVPNDFIGRLAILAIALFLGVFGLAMLLAARRRRSALDAFAMETSA